MKAAMLHKWLSWTAVGVLAGLCGALAVLQYRWIGEISDASERRLRDELLQRMSSLRSDFNERIAAICNRLQPDPEEVERSGQLAAYEARYAQWRSSHEAVFRRIDLVVPKDTSLLFFALDLQRGTFSSAPWPPEWSGMKKSFSDRLLREPSPPPFNESPLLIDFPRFVGSPGEPRREHEWLILEMNPDYARTTLLPEILARYLGGAGKLDYDIEVAANGDPSYVIFRFPPNVSIERADARIGLLETGPGLQRGGRPGPGGPPLTAGPLQKRTKRLAGGPPFDSGLWVLSVRHHAGSLEALVAQARHRNLAVSAVLLALILSSVGVLVLSSRRAQALGQMQINFVASVSHELRTPLTVIRTAAFNLRTKVARQPEQVEKYGELIQRESERLTGLVEQVLQFGNANAELISNERTPIAVDRLIGTSLEASDSTLRSSDVEVEELIEPGLPLVLANEAGMRHVLQNLVDNAVRHGRTNGGSGEFKTWVGIFACAIPDKNHPIVEIRVADKGEGIPAEERARIFDPFFRGSRARSGQTCGAGLGLSIVKRIVEAHGGSISVSSEPGKGSEFIVQLPAVSSARAL
jgi:signal transduction histidine kinase